MRKRKLARITGWSFIIMSVIAGFSFGYAYPEFYNPEQLDSTKSNLIQKISLYEYMLIGILIIAILDMVISCTLFKYFEDDNRKVSLVSALLRIVYTLTLGSALYCLTRSLNPTEVSNELIIHNFNSFQLIWTTGLIVFGVHLLLVGYLMKIHNRIPKILWTLTFIAGASYIVVHSLKVMLPASEIVPTLDMILALPMALGELGLAVWLIIYGGKEYT